MAVHFHIGDNVSGKVNQRRNLKRWIRQVIERHDKKLGQINYVFMTDEDLLQINQEYLQHNYYTDIITFDLSSDQNMINADIFISYDRVIDNAHSLAETIEKELHRVIIHGILHLLGFKDNTKKQKDLMRNKEDEMLAQYPSV